MKRNILNIRRNQLEPINRNEDISLHEKAQMIVDNDEAFRRLKEDLRASKAVTSVGVNAVLNKCMDFRIQESNLCLSSLPARRNSRLTFSNDIVGRVRNNNNSNATQNGGKMNMFQKLQSVMNLEGEVKSNLELYQRKSYAENNSRTINNRRPSAIVSRRSTDSEFKRRNRRSTIAALSNAMKAFNSSDVL